MGGRKEEKRHHESHDHTEVDQTQGERGAPHAAPGGQRRAAPLPRTPTPKDRNRTLWTATRYGQGRLGTCLSIDRSVPALTTASCPQAQNRKDLSCARPLPTLLGGEGLSEGKSEPNPTAIGFAFPLTICRAEPGRRIGHPGRA